MKHLVIFSLLLCTLGACIKKETTYTCYFYTPASGTEKKLFLYVDDEYKGELPALSSKPGLTNDSLLNYTNSFTLKWGKHELEAKSADGQIVSAGTLKIKPGKMESCGGQGGQEISSDGSRVVVSMFE